MDLDRLDQILDEVSILLRKGEVVERHGGVTEIYAMPHTSEAPSLEKVDCHFIDVGVDKDKAEKYRDELISILKTYPNPERLEGGPSYIEVGGIIGSQDRALQLFAVGEVLKFWKVVTPEKLGITGAKANMLAGSGLVMISGFKGGEK